MLHRKLILALGSLIVMILGTSIWAIVLFAAAVGDLSEMGEALLGRTSSITAIESDLEQIERELTATRNDGTPNADSVVEQAMVLRDRLRGQQGTDIGGLKSESMLLGHADQLIADAETLAAATDATARAQAARSALDTALQLRQAISGASSELQVQFELQLQAMTTRLRWWAFGLGLAFLVVLNLSIMVIIRAVGMILKPVGELVEASRHLAAEEFDYRVPVYRRDEFGELARATNRMAEQLSHNEQRRIETLQQVARTLNHELNNAISIIDLQLRLMQRHDTRVAETGEFEQHLQQIHHTLHTMSSTVASLTRLRRVVLTDYVGQVKMVDLQRSLESDEGETGSTEGCVEAHSR